MSLPHDTIMAEVSLGIDAEAFVLSPVGRYIIACCDREVEEATEKLKRVDPRDEPIISSLLHRIRVAEQIPKWLAEAIQAGHNAEYQLTVEKAEDGG